MVSVLELFSTCISWFTSDLYYVCIRALSNPLLFSLARNIAITQFSTGWFKELRHHS